MKHIEADVSAVGIVLDGEGKTKLIRNRQTNRKAKIVSIF